MAAVNAPASDGVNIDCAGASIRLLPDGAVMWEATATLWLSDLHLGKAAHFRKHGVPIGSEPTLATLHRLRQQLMQCSQRGFRSDGHAVLPDRNPRWLHCTDCGSS